MDEAAEGNFCCLRGGLILKDQRVFIEEAKRGRMRQEDVKGWMMVHLRPQASL